MSVAETRVVLFVCLHGAYRSRLAAAFFNAVAGPGWRATSAGVEPQAQISPTAVRLVSGTAAAGALDPAPPRAVTEAGPADRIIAVDCDVPGAERWTLATADAGPDQRDEIRARAERLAVELSEG
jgi:arsenate reductase (thioredoxin)